MSITEQEQLDSMGPLKNYEHIIALRNARVEKGIPLAYGVGTNGAIPKVNKEKIQAATRYRKGEIIVMNNQIHQVIQ